MNEEIDPQSFVLFSPTGYQLRFDVFKGNPGIAIFAPGKNKSGPIFRKVKDREFYVALYELCKLIEKSKPNTKHPLIAYIFTRNEKNRVSGREIEFVITLIKTEQNTYAISVSFKNGTEQFTETFPLTLTRKISVTSNETDQIRSQLKLKEFMTWIQRFWSMSLVLTKRKFEPNGQFNNSSNSTYKNNNNIQYTKRENVSSNRSNQYNSSNLSNPSNQSSNSSNQQQKEQQVNFDEPADVAPPDKLIEDELVFD